MSFGMAVYNPNGSLMFNLDNRLSRLISVIDFYIPPSSGYASIDISVPGYVQDGTWGITLLLQDPSAYDVPRDTHYAGGITLTSGFSGKACSGTMVVFRL
jgi:hypothetical protein